MPGPLTVIVLAAGEGTRMKSRATPKVLHEFAGRSLLGHALAATADLGAQRTAVVIGHLRDHVAEHLRAIAPHAEPVVQHEQNGTGHAVRIVLEQLRAGAGEPDAQIVLVLPGDAPLLRPETLGQLVRTHVASGAAATMLNSRVPDPTGYGRVIRSADGSVARVVEQRDASPDELAVDEVSSLVYVFDGALLRDAVSRLSTANAQGEEYLPDVVGILVADGRAVRAELAPPDETAGVNDRVQLAAAHRSFNARLIEQHMRAGVTVIDPSSTWIDAGVRLAPDVVLHPATYLEGATSIGAGSRIGPDVTLTDTVVGEDSALQRVVANRATIGNRVTVGPYAYLRPGTDLADDVHIGTFVELKAADIGVGTKVPHLTYVGDATIGEHSNIGASSVFVNYDGVHKHRSTIGSHARTGADTMFVAPVTVGDGAYTAAGSVISEDVPPGALGIARSQQRNVAGWVLKRRAGTPAAAAAEAAGATAPPPKGDQPVSDHQPGSTPDSPPNSETSV
jgi:bifunctional UDP-N-acetylglucosamine pyrophosphorylase/glucosamine-1-phosphate N-acetyltransferase